MSARDRAGASASRGNGLARALSSLDSRFEVRETTSGSTVVASRREPLAGFKEEEAEPAPATPLEPLSDGQCRHVVITGCDSGFGNAVALRVAKLPGYRVHALCLLADSVASLSALGVAGLNPIQCDVTKDADVAAAAAAVARETDRIWALVNNAGIGGGSTLEFSDVEVFQRIMDVNYMGSVRVAKAFLAMLHANKSSRLLQMSSASGRCSIGGAGAYCASKAAVTSWATTFAIENKWWGVQVSIFEPNHFKTPMAERLVTGLERTFAALPDETKEKYGEDYFTARTAAMKKKIADAADPEIVVKAMVDGITLSEALPLRNPLGPNYGGLLRLQQAPYDIQFLIMQGSFASVAKPAAVQG